MTTKLPEGKKALKRELEALERRLEETRQKLSKLSPLPVYWKKVRCGKDCRTCPHGPYPYLKVKRGKRWGWTYLGKGWQPPEGWVRPKTFRRLLFLYHGLLKRREALLKELGEKEGGAGYNEGR